MLLNLITVQKLDDFWNQMEFEKIKNSKECKEFGKMAMKKMPKEQSLGAITVH